MGVETIDRAEASRTGNRLRIDLLFLDLTTCSRCLGANRSLEGALEVVRGVVDATGVEVEVNKILVESEEQARAHRFASSPTIRVNGRDVALELRESSCGSEACTDGCGGAIACRVWVHRGEEYTEPPVAMIVDAILGRLYDDVDPNPAAGAVPYELPENVARFFAGKAEASASEEGPCCSASERMSCCDAAEKAECCGASTEAGCGCR
jgi:hypothetical protein